MEAYVNFSKNAVILEVNPSANAKQVQETILDGAKLYSEIFTGSARGLKKAEKRIKKLEKHGRFDEYAREKEGYEKLKEKLEDPKQKDDINPRIIVNGFEEVVQNSRMEEKTCFKKLVEELKNDAQNEKEKRVYSMRASIDEVYPYFHLLESKHYKKKFDKALRTYDALDYMSKKLEFHQYCTSIPLAKAPPGPPPASPRKNTATTTTYRKA